MKLSRIVATMLLVLVSIPCATVLAADTSVPSEHPTVDATMPASIDGHATTNQDQVNKQNLMLILTQPPRDGMYVIGRDGPGPLPSPIEIGPAPVVPPQSYVADPPGTPKPDVKPPDISDLCLNVLGCSGDGLVRPNPISGPAEGTIGAPNQGGPAPVTPPATPPLQIAPPRPPVVPVLPPDTDAKPISPPDCSDPAKCVQPPSPFVGITFPQVSISSGKGTEPYPITVVSGKDTLTVTFDMSATDGAKSSYTLNTTTGTIKVVHVTYSMLTGKVATRVETLTMANKEKFVAVLKTMMSLVDTKGNLSKTGSDNQVQLKWIYQSLLKVYRIAIGRLIIRPIPVPVDPRPVPVPLASETTSSFGRLANTRSVAPVDKASQ